MKITNSTTKQVTIVEKELRNKDLQVKFYKPNDEFEPHEKDLVVDAHLEWCLDVIQPLLVAQNGRMILK